MKKLRTLRNADDPQFSTIRRKLARWAADNVRIIKEAGARGCDVRMFGCLYVHQEPHGNNIGACRSLSPIQTRRGKNIAAEAQSPKTKSRRCCETMIFVPSSFIRLSEPISRGTVTGQRNSRTRSRASCPTSRTSEHSRAGARGCDVRMFGCLPLDGPHREGGLLAGLPLSRTTLTQQFFGSAPQISATLPQRHRQFCSSSSLTEGTLRHLK